MEPFDFDSSKVYTTDTFLAPYSQPAESGLSIVMKKSVIHERKNSKHLAKKQQQEELLDRWEIVHQAKLNLAVEIEYLQKFLTQFKDEQISGSQSYYFYTEDVKKAQLQEDKKMYLPNANQNETNQMLKNMQGLTYHNGAANIKAFIKGEIIKLTTIKEKVLQEIPEAQLTNEWNKILKQLFKTSCYLERIRLYLDNQIYPRDAGNNIVDIEIDKYKEPLESSQLGESIQDLTGTITKRKLTTYKDFFTSYELCKKITSKIEKMKEKDLDDIGKDHYSADRQQMGLLSMDLDNNEKSTGHINFNKDAKDLEELKKQVKNNNVLKKELFYGIVDEFSPSLANLRDPNKILNQEICLQVIIKDCYIGSNEIEMILYQENDVQISDSTRIDPCGLFDAGKYGFAFVNIPMRILVSNNLALIINVIQKKQNTKIIKDHKLLKTNSDQCHLKLYKGFSIIPLTKLFWAGQLKNGITNNITQAKFYRPSQRFKIEEGYVQLIEKKQLSKYSDEDLTKSINFDFNYTVSTKAYSATNPNEKDLTVIKRTNNDSLDVFIRDKEFIQRALNKQEYRFNDMRIDLKSLSLGEVFLKKQSPVIRIEVALRDSYGTVYDTVYVQKCGEQIAFGEIYESQIYSTNENINIHESFYMRIPTKNFDTLKKLYLVFTIQTIIHKKDAKGNKIKIKSIHQELENLQFQTEVIGVIPLFNWDRMSIIKNEDSYKLNLYHMDHKKFHQFKKISQITEMSSYGDELQLYIKVISNEFTHNQFINQLMQTNNLQDESAQFETTLSQLKEVDPEELINFHDNILDKLFQVLTLSKKAKVQDLVFETVIQIIELFQNKHKDYHDLLQNYIQNHYAPQKAYISLLHQLRQTSEIVKQGFKAENDFHNEDCLLATMKYLGIILKLIRNSFLEEQQCQGQLDQYSDDNPESYKMKKFREITSIEGMEDNIPKAHTVQNNTLESISQSLLKYETLMKIKHSMIEEEDEEEDFFVRNNLIGHQQPVGENGQSKLINDNYFEKHSNNNDSSGNKFGSPHFVNYNPHQSICDPVIKKSLMRKKQIRKVMKGDGILNKTKFSKAEITNIIQRAILSVFQGCHKDSMKATISLRAILYENIIDVLEQIVDFMDDRYFTQLMSFFHKESMNINNQGNPLTGNYNTGSTSDNRTPNVFNRRSTRPVSFNMNQDISMQFFYRKGSTTSNLNQYKMGSRQSELIEDYVTNQNFIEGLKELNFINEEYIVKMKIVAMGQIISSGILQKIKGNTNKIILNFCKCIEQNYLRRPELSTQVFYFLHQLFAYLNLNEEGNQQEAFLSKEKQEEKKSNDALKSLTNTINYASINKKLLNLGSFFAQILPEITAYTRMFHKENNPSLRLKESAIIEKALSPYLEKTTLVCLSVMNSISKDDIKYIIDEPLRHLILVQNLKKLAKIISFKEPYNQYFDKKKIQVIRKINAFQMLNIMEHKPQNFSQKQQDVIVRCRMLHLQLWVMVAQTKEKQHKSLRYRLQQKDQLNLSKGQMLVLYKQFYKQYESIGKPWLQLDKIKTIITQMSELIKSSSQKTLQLFMELLGNTAVIEFQNTESVQHTSSCLFQVFNDIHQSKDHNEVSKKFNETFQKVISETDLYKNNQQFNKIIGSLLNQMQQLREAMQYVWDSNNTIGENQNIFYQAYCQALLMDAFWELKLFKMFSGNRERFKALQKQMGDYSEMAFTDLRFLEIIQQSEESQIYIGQREITALIQIDLMRGIVENLIKADLYEKAVDVLNQIKQLYEKVLFDYEAVSKLLVEQSKVYKEMSEKQNRHYAVYFKVGFYGAKYPPIFRNQEFIYKSSKLSKRLDVFSEIKKHFKDVIIINDSSKPKAEIHEGNLKFVQIVAVAPFTFRELKDFGLADKNKDKEELDIGEEIKYLPEHMKVYYIENFKNKFYQETVIQGQVMDELENDIQIEIFKVKNKFPSLFKMQKIYKVPKKIQLNAIDRAIRAVDGLNEKMQQQIQNVTNQIYEQGNLKQLGGFIHGTLDSKIQGGIQKYIDVFVNQEYLGSNQKYKVQELVKKIQDHAQIVGDALQLFQQNCDDDRLVTKFQGDFQLFKENLDQVKNYVEQSLNNYQNTATFDEEFDISKNSFTN